MTVNIKRGFNRIYIVLAAVWLLYCAVLFPLQRQAEATRQFDQEGAACWSMDDSQERSTCLTATTTNWNAQMHQWQFRWFYSWAWGFLLLAVVVLPIVVYGFCRGAAAIAVWVWKGFRVPSL